MNVWVKRSLLVLVVLILIFGWVLHFHNAAVAGAFAEMGLDAEGGEIYGN